MCNSCTQVFHIDSIGITYKCTRKKRVTKFFHIDSIGTLQQCSPMEVRTSKIGTL